MRKLLIGVGVTTAVLAAAAGGAFYYVSNDFGLLLEWFGTPDAPFAETGAPAAPNYGDAGWWAARPASAGAKPVDVFYLHPTTYLFGSGWNAAPDDAASRKLVDESIVPHQAGAFTDCCNVHVPRYRQAILHVFTAKDADSRAALDLAYTDVEAAFDTFIGSIDGRPFIVAAHSQGSLHGMRLLQTRISGTPLRERLVGAYLVGYAIPVDGLGDVPACTTATDTGCYVGWNSMEPGSAAWTTTLVWKGGWGEATGLPICTNPLSWEVDGSAPASANLGGTVPGGEPPGAHVAELTDARCDGGRLLITPPEQGDFDILMGKTQQDWHVYDYTLFFGNIRANASQRVEAWLQSHPPLPS